MADFVVLSKQDLAAVLDLQTVMDAVEQAFVQKSARQASLIPMLYHALHAQADLDIKAGHMGRQGIYGLKLISWFGRNPEKGLPALQGTTLLFDDTTGQPIALLNAEDIGLLRTGAAAGLGAKHLAAAGAHTLLLVGTGRQAAYHMAAMALAVPGLDTILLYNPHGADKAAARLPALQAEAQTLLAACGKQLTATVAVADDLPAAVGQSQIIVTATPAQTALIDAAWVALGTHFSCMGADVKGKQELDPMILKKARVFADDLEQAIKVGECQNAINRGIMFQTELAGELGAVMAKTMAGRMHPEQITVFDSTGIALQDLAVAKAAYDLARQKGIGTAVAL
ncbi:MAG: hypothetical protein IJ347_01475 [Faecalibacterium sp.]|nr:hypothetical protein [Faecalibacterium sp.]